MIAAMRTRITGAVCGFEVLGVLVSLFLAFGASQWLGSRSFSDFSDCETTMARSACGGLFGELKFGYITLNPKHTADDILHYLKDPKLWELWYIPYYG